MNICDGKKTQKLKNQNGESSRLFNPNQQAKERIIKTLQAFDFSLEQLGRIEEILNE